VENVNGVFDRSISAAFVALGLVDHVGRLAIFAVPQGIAHSSFGLSL